MIQGWWKWLLTSHEFLRVANFVVGKIGAIALVEGLLIHSVGYNTWIAPVKANPTDWAQYRLLHTIPEMVSYELKHFEEFFQQRRALLLQKLKMALA